MTYQIFQTIIQNGWLFWLLITVTVQQPLYFERCLVSRHEGTWWHYSYSNVISLGRTPRWSVCKIGSGEEKALLYPTMSFCLFRIFWFRSHPTKCYFLTNLTFFCYYFCRLHGQLVNVSMAIIDSFLWMKTDFSIHRQRLHSSFLVLKYF